jgi:murein DD-endopeptidase MepM/ murein hydrolase activator NlpD
MPVSFGYVSQGYTRYHRAIDIATGSVGVPIKPLGSGQVEFAGRVKDGKGNVVIVNHGNGLKTLYAHMGKISVGTGDSVNEESVIGNVGMTGRTTGAHLHLEIYDNDKMVDPTGMLPSNVFGPLPKLSGKRS